MAYMTNLLIGFDQFVNTVLGGWPDETISARAWRRSPAKRRWAVARQCIDWLALVLFRQHNHCEMACLEEVKRRQGPAEDLSHLFGGRP